MTPIKLNKTQTGDFLLSYYRSDDGSIKVVTCIQIIDQIYMKILGGKSRRSINKHIMYDNNPSVLKVYNIKGTEYLERNGYTNDIEFFKLNNDEVQMLMLEFI